MKKNLLAGLAAVVFLFGMAGMASATTIDFETSSVGTAVYDQFSPMGIYVRSALDISATGAPGIVTSSHTMQVADHSQGVYFIFDSPVQSLSAFVYEFGPEQDGGNEKEGTVMYDFDGTDEEELSVKEGEKVTILKDVGEWLYVRNVAGEEGYVPASYVEQSVYLEVFGFNGDSYFLLDDSMVVHALEKWDEIRFESQTPIRAFRLWGTRAFYVDNITMGTPTETPRETPTETPVPEPATFVLFGIGLFGLFALMQRRRRQKK